MINSITDPCFGTVLAVCISKPVYIEVNGKKEYTGYFKKSQNVPVLLTPTGVQGDTVVDTVHHGGVDKACYLFSHHHYAYWKERYPDRQWDYGMFGENITLDKLQEEKIRIGDIFQLGQAQIQVSQPRQPCYKMGIKFRDQDMVQAFRKYNSPGLYVRVLVSGTVSTGDQLVRLKTQSHFPSVTEVFRLLYEAQPGREILQILVRNPFLSQSIKEYLIKKHHL